MPDLYIYLFYREKGNVISTHKNQLLFIAGFNPFQI